MARAAKIAAPVVAPAETQGEKIARIVKVACAAFTNSEKLMGNLDGIVQFAATLPKAKKAELEGLLASLNAADDAADAVLAPALVELKALARELNPRAPRGSVAQTAETTPAKPMPKAPPKPVAAAPVAAPKAPAKPMPKAPPKPVAAA